jgi:hypothetical protein
VLGRLEAELQAARKDLTALASSLCVAPPPPQGMTLTARRRWLCGLCGLFHAAQACAERRYAGPARSPAA